MSYIGGMGAVGSARKRIGVLCNHIGGSTRPLENEVARALFDVADERDLDIVFLPGRFFRSDSGEIFQDRFFGNAAPASCVDGLILLSSLLSRHMRNLDFAAFLRSLGDMPIVCLGMALGGLPSVLTDNRESMRRTVLHLADRHGARRIAFIRGPHGNREADERLEGYRAALAERGIAYNPELILPGEFDKASGVAAVENFYTRRGLSCDAIVAANDETALGAMDALAARGIRCPEDVRVCGFDDIEASRLVFPPLATTRQNLYGMARMAGELLYALLEGRPGPSSSVVPSIFVPRGSCGCRKGFAEESDAADGGDETVDLLAAFLKSLPSVGKRHRTFFEEKCAEFVAALEADRTGWETEADRGDPDRCNNGASGTAGDLLAGILKETENAGLNPGLWLEPMKALYGKPTDRSEDRCRADAVFIGLSRLVCDFSADAQKRAAHRQDRYDFSLGEISQALIGAKSLTRVGEILSANLATLDIDLCLIALSDPPTLGGNCLRPALICGGEGCMEFPKGNQLSISRGLSGYRSPRVQIVEMLTLRDEYFGVAVFGMEKPLGQITAILRMHISGTLKAIRDHEESERKRATIEALNRDYEKQLRRLSSLRAIDMAITGERASDESLNILLEQTLSQLGADAASILLAVDGGAGLEFGAGLGFKTEALKHTKLRIGEGYAGEAALGRTVVMVPDLEKSLKDFGRAPLLHKEGFAAYCAAPLYARGVLMGVLELFHRAPLQPDGEWKEFLEALAGQAAIALDNRSLIRGLQKANNDLLLAYDETIEGWSRALDLRDHETKGHSIRVAVKAVELGRRLKLDEKELALMYRGALLHDIGKVGIPDSVLLKPGNLTEEETALMRRHPRYAYDLLYPIAYLRPVIDIPYCHHEKWDGSGYPRGLSGREIPLSARVFAVIDVWDALTSERPYREAWTEPAALSYLREHSGEHFDPDIIKSFL